ncbi:MAG: hypothetical protein ACKOEM_11735 [Planctomycetia bacterium]
MMTRGEPYPDAILDAALRAVEVPLDLGNRLRPERLFDERAIDRMLLDVAVPAGLADRVRFRAADVLPRAGDEPVSVEGRPVRIHRWFRRLAREGMAVALSLGLIVAMFFAGLWITDVATRATAERHLARRAAAGTGRVAGAAAVRSAAGSPVAERSGEASSPDRVNREPAPPPAAPRAEAVVERDRPQPDAPLIVRTAPLPSAGDLDRDGRPRSAVSSGMRVVSETGVGDMRRAVPTMRGFDLAFEMAHGESPFVDPSIAPALAADRPPLVIATDSFDRVWPLPPGRRRQAEIERIRVEHLIASLSSDVATSGDGAPRLELSAVRSIRPGRPSYLVELRVALPVAPAEVGPVEAQDVTVVLDHSAGPEALPLWLATCRGLAAAADRMGPADRLTVVVAEPRPRRVAIRMSAPEIGRLSRELEEEPPFGSADLDAAVALAEQTAASEGSAGRLVVVAHADRAERCDGAAGDALRRSRVALARGQEGAGSSPRFVLVSGVSDGADSAGLAEVPGWTLSDPTIVRRRCADVVADRPAIVADDVVLEVRFDPRVIAAYRLVGHRQGVPESLAAFGKRSSGAASLTMSGGETARVVYEVVLRSEPVAELKGVGATLTYRQPSGAVRAIAASGAAVDASERSVPSPQGCELLLAVGIGECAGRSVHAVPQRLAIERLRELASAWHRRGDVTVVGERLIGVLDDIAAGGAASPPR